jgi:chromosome segregation ATPase
LIEHKSSQQKELTKKLQEQIAILSDARNELSSKALQLETSIRNYQMENNQKELEIERLKKKEKQEILFVSKELENLKHLNADLEQQISKLQRQREDRDDKLNSSIVIVTNELASLQHVIESVIAGNSMSIDLTEENNEIDLGPLEGIRSVLIGTKSRIIDSLYEISELREKIRNYSIEMDMKNAALASMEVEKAEAQKELLHLRKQIADLEKTVHDLEEQKVNLERNVTELEYIVEDQQEEERNRTKFVQQLFTLLKNNSEETYPIKIGKASLDQESMNWETLQTQFAELLSAHILEKETLKNDKISLENKILELESRYARQIQLFKDAQQKYEEEAKELEKEKERELESMKVRYESEIDVLTRDYKSKINDLEEKYIELQTQFSDLTVKQKKSSITIDMQEKDIEELHHEKEKLQNCLKLLACGIRPMRAKIADLKEHKKILNLQVRYLERLHKNMFESVKQLSAEFHLEEELGFSPDLVSKPKASFRAAAIAVVAFNRFVKIKTKDKKNQVYNIGDDKIQLLPFSEVEDIDAAKLPFGERLEQSTVQTFMQLCLYLDPKFDEKSTKDMRLIMSLQDGLDNIVNRRQYPSYISTSLIQTPTKRKQVTISDNAIAHKSPAKKSIERVQKATLSITKVMRDLAKERSNMQKEVIELREKVSRMQKYIGEIEENTRKKQELIEFMEVRTNELQAENMKLIQPEKYNLLQKEIEKIRENYANIQYEKEKYKQEYEAQVQLLNTYRKDVKELQEKLRDATSRLELVQRELQNKNSEAENLQSILMKGIDIGTTSTSPMKTENLMSSSMSPTFSSLRKRVEKDLNDSQIMMKQLTESTAKTNREVHELDKELKHARKHLAELQQNLNNSYTSPTRTRTPVSPSLNISTELNKDVPGSTTGKASLRSRNFTLDDSTDLEVQEDLFSSSRPPSRRSKRRSITIDY